MRLRLAWPVGTRLHWQASKDLGALAPTIVNGVNQIVATFTNPTLPDDLAQGAPSRFAIRRLIEASSFATSTDLSRRMFPLFDKAASLAPASPLHAEIARIATTTDPVARMDTPVTKQAIGTPARC